MLGLSEDISTYARYSKGTLQRSWSTKGWCPIIVVFYREEHSSLWKSGRTLIRGENTNHYAAAALQSIGCVWLTFMTPSRRGEIDQIEGFSCIDSRKRQNSSTQRLNIQITRFCGCHLNHLTSTWPLTFTWNRSHSVLLCIWGWEKHNLMDLRNLLQCE